MHKTEFQVDSIYARTVKTLGEKIRRVVMGLEIRTIRTSCFWGRVGHGVGLTGKGQERTFWGAGSVLCPVSCGGYTGAQNRPGPLN